MAKIAVILVAFVVAFTAKVDANFFYEWEYYRDMLAHFTESEKPDPCGHKVIAYYKFDRSFRDVCFGNNPINVAQLQPSAGILNGAAYFYFSKLSIPSLNGYEWGSKFSVSFWLKTLAQDWPRVKKGLINNGVINNEAQGIGNRFIGSWEISLRYGSISASILTSHSNKTWDGLLPITSGLWHHFVMSYDGSAINFYLDNHLQINDTECCHGDIMTKASDVVIGYRRNGGGYLNDGHFRGYIDEVKLFKKALNAREVTKLYRLKDV